jgi:DGQHR domain-containing protein
MPTKARKHTGKKTGQLAQTSSVPCIPAAQGKSTLYLFAQRCSELWNLVSINRREEDKDEGYQRVLSSARVRAIADYILEENTIPGAIIISLDNAKFDQKSQALIIPKGKDIAWVIDGQHRLAGAHLASTEGVDIELPVVALLSLPDEEQIEQFVTINREAKGVPTSLYLDLLKLLPKRKSSSELASERAADIANELRRNKQSIFFNRIVVTTSPRQGQISITNFVRKIAPLVNPERGLLNRFTLPEQRLIIDNFFHALKDTFPSEWASADNIFFKTIGFGAIMNVFEDVFKETIVGGGFRVQDIVEILKPVRGFNLEQWREKGTGSKAETDAARDFLVDFSRGIDRLKQTNQSRGIRL